MGGKGSTQAVVALVCALSLAACSSPGTRSSPTPSVAAIVTPLPTSLAIVAGPMQWNTQDPNANSNGNARLIAGYLKATEPAKLRRAAENVSPAAVARAPWEYYGKPVRLRGQVLSARDLPRGGQTARDLGVDQVSELLLVAEDGTRVNYLYLDSVDTVRAGAKVYVCGYAVGLVPADASAAGKPTVPLLVGRSVEG